MDRKEELINLLGIFLGDSKKQSEEVKPKIVEICKERFDKIYEIYRKYGLTNSWYDEYDPTRGSLWLDDDYNEDAIQQLVSPENDFYDDIAIHYYTQYHLHLQLKDAVDYAHKNGVIIKGDLPIGVGRYSCDAWMYRDLFHMDMQAGAPPDAFATK